ncbi:hypothetical protein KEM52_005520 [Ascosphaera acerosa]|nr:hypothetical protein KEM52_005520 [Ascosphaera acerosa]
MRLNSHWGVLGTAVQAESLATSPPFYPSPWLDGQGDWAEAYEKAKAFVSQLTLAERVNLTTGTGWEMDSCVGQIGSIDRVGFAGLCLQDSPLGIRFGDYVSSFPAGVNVAATFSKQLAYERGRAMGEEFRDKGIDVQLGPVVGPIGRSPHMGRNWEGFSPDPVVSGKLAAESIKGIQDAGVIANLKHFIGYEQEHFRQAPESAGYGYNISDSVSSNIDDVTMHELYLWPWADAVRAGVGSIMCSYNQVNNSYACQNSYMLNKLLKGELGFQGFVVTDWQAQHSGVGSALAGLDMSMPGDTVFDTGDSFWGTNLTIAVLNGTVPQWRVNDMATRIMAAYFKVHRDAHKVPVNFNSWDTSDYGYLHYFSKKGWGRINEHLNVRAQHAVNARDVAAKSIVLLKNTNNALPLTGFEKQVGIFGEDAGPSPGGPNGCADHGCDSGTLAGAWGSGSAPFPYLVTPYEAIQRKVLDYGVGSVLSVLDSWDFSKVDSVLDLTSVAIVFANADSGEGYIVVDGNYGDRNNLTLWGNGDNLINHVASQHNNTIVVIHSVGPVVPAGWHSNPNVTAIVWAGLPGQESGNALADVLYGRVNPGGKSPFTWAAKDSDYGTNLTWTPNNGHGAPQSDFTEGIFIDYRHFDKHGLQPVWPFGHGLSYTTFKYTDIKVNVLPAPKYTNSDKVTTAAPTFGNISTDAKDYLFPDAIQAERVPLYIYPWLNTTDLGKAAGNADFGRPSDKYIPEGALSGAPQKTLPAGGGPGGNPRLYDELYEVVVTIENTGDIIGDAVPQLYVALGGPNDARVVLRDFDRVSITPGVPYTWRTTLTRRDVSNWDVVAQNWAVTDHEKTVFVGSSSRDLPLVAKLPPPRYIEV